MPLYRIYFSITCHDRKFNSSYELVAARTVAEARKITRQRALKLYDHLPPKSLSVRTSIKGFI